MEITRTEGLRNPQEAAAYLGISRRTLFELKAQRRIGFVRIGRVVRFTQGHLDTFVAENSVGAR